MTPGPVSLLVVSIPTNVGENHFLDHFRGELARFIQRLASPKFDDPVLPERISRSISRAKLSKSPVLSQKSLWPVRYDRNQQFQMRKIWMTQICS
jgi:hypothetical protein